MVNGFYINILIYDSELAKKEERNNGTKMDRTKVVQVDFTKMDRTKENKSGYEVVTFEIIILVKKNIHVFEIKIQSFFSLSLKFKVNSTTAFVGHWIFFPLSFGPMTLNLIALLSTIWHENQHIYTTNHR